MTLTNQLQAVLHQEGFKKPVTDVFGKRGREWLAGLELSAAARVVVDTWLREVDHLDKELAAQTRELERMAKIALARKLLTVVWALLRHRVCFDEELFVRG
jgi:hypothetical protein